MKNNYYVTLVNSQGCIFDSKEFSNLKEAKKWASGRGSDYHTRIRVNGEEEPSIVYTNKN